MSTRETCYKVIESMPTLKHRKEGDLEFNIAGSEVVAWLVKQPEVQQWIFDQVRDAGGIIYDPATGTWKGAIAVQPYGPPYTGEEMMAVLGKESMKFAQWQFRCEEKLGRKVGRWTFVRSMQPLLEDGVVFKIGTNYRAAI